MNRETVEIKGLAEVAARLRALPAAMVSSRGGPVRVGLRKGALVIRDAMRRNLQAIIDQPNVGGDDDSTGLMVKSIDVRRGRPHPTLKGERYWVMIPKSKRYPTTNSKTRSGIRVETVARMLEYGTSRRDPMPWAGPAFHAKKREAVAVVVQEVERAIKTIERRVARGAAR